MTIHAWQKEILKEMLLDPILQKVINLCKGNEPLIEPLIMHSLANKTSQEQIREATECIIGEKYIKLASSLMLLAKIHEEKVFIAHDYNGNSPTVGELRLAIYEIIIDFLDHKIQGRNFGCPTLSKVEALEGMDKIRSLFIEYLTITQPLTIERYKIALEVIIEKEKLNLPSFISSDENLFVTNSCSTPGDFSNLELSKIQIKRELKDIEGSFKGLYLNNSNLEGAVFSGIDFFGANMSNCNLKDINLSNNFNVDEIILSDANLVGAYLGEIILVDM
jgi:uncharacterized protein YjbI with pentapeptide repeats